MKTAVIILNWNGADVLPKYLPSVVEHTPSTTARIIVADNASTDGSAEYAEQYESVEVVRLDANYGFAQGYNIAIKQVEAEYVVLLNSDVSVSEGWLEPLISYLDQHDEVAAVQPKILSFREPNMFEHAGAAGGLLDLFCYPYCRGRRLDKVASDEGQYDTVEPIFWASGACLCIRRSAYLQNGGLDARFFAHMEEIDLCWRLKARGMEIYVVPQSKVWHYGGASLPYDNPRKTFLNFRNNLLMIYKNAHSRYFFLIMMVRFVLDYLALAVMLLKGERQNARAVYNARIEYHKMKKSFAEDRINNISKTLVRRPLGWTRRSVLVDHFLIHKTV